jgi:hypothetical protein
MGRRRLSVVPGSARRGRRATVLALARRFPILLQSLLSLSLLASAPLHAGSEPSQIAIATAATRLAPPDLARQIERHKGELRAGVIEPFRDGDRARHEKNGDGSAGGMLDRVIADEARRAVSYIREHRPFHQVVRQLGVLLHFVADANHPLYASADDPGEGSYAADYHRYVTRAEPRFAAAYYGVDPRLDGLDAIPAFVQRSLARSRALYPYIGGEYRRIGGGTGVGVFDDRSTAFGVAAVSFSRALTDGASMLRLVWLEAGGADPLRRPSVDSGRIVKLPRPSGERKSP